MSPARCAVFGLALLGACDGSTAERLLDTGWFDEIADVGVDCAARIDVTTPTAGQVGWYGRNPLRVFVGDPEGTYGVRVIESNGREVAVEQVWDADGTAFSVVAAEGYAPDTDHRLLLDDCTGPSEVSFRTSTLGLPLEGGNASLEGRTWELRIGTAEWVQPSGVGLLLASQIDRLILLGAFQVGTDTVTLMGADGDIDVGVITQYLGGSTWLLPGADFSQAPYFEAVSDQVRLSIGGALTPVTDFQLQGTFSADGSAIGGARLSGLADTRDVGGAIGQPNNKSAFCTLAATLNADCVPCPDGEVYCIDVLVEDLEGVEVPNVTLRPTGN